MRTFGSLITIGTASLLVAGQALAQGRPLPPQPPPPRSQQAAAGHATPPAPPPSATVTPRVRYNRYSDQPVLFTDVPATVASDGRVYANFGFGYQLVPLQCSAQRLAPSQSQAPAPYAQPQVVQPVPGQPTPPVPVQSGSQLVPVNGAGACWFQARDGRVLVRR